MVNRIFVEKKNGFNIPAKKALEDIKEVLKINATDLRLFLMYDSEGIDAIDFKSVIENVFSEPPCDFVYKEQLPDLRGYKVFGVEYLKGQYDQRADSAEQCTELFLKKDRPKVASATVYAIEGVTEDELSKIKEYFVNPTDSKVTNLQKPETLYASYPDRDEIDYMEGFINLDKKEVENLHNSFSFAMSKEDLAYVQAYFKKEKRNPTVTELKVIDTYWSDHCRHTTFLTELKDIKLNKNKDVIEAFNIYKELFNELYKDRQDKYVCLMDIATIGTKALKRKGLLTDLDESDEINACSIKVTAEVDGKKEDWLVMFKNETHNHPTEIEPFGGAATCLGGAIRDPLSGRVYVYQAMRVTGAGDIFKDVSQTLKGKLPQRVISKTAAHGFSSYGNQIGLATGIVAELHHDNYQAKRLETGFVIGAAQKENVVRKSPVSGDKILLIGGETGRDGCGGATGSSKAHNKESVNQCGAEVQKGNPLIERKIQRFFRNKEASTLIKKCNDFGAGGISVAIGELADGLDIYLHTVPKKYKGLTVTETAISESQERMAVVVEAKDVEKFLSLVKEENLTGTVVAQVTDLNRLRMFNKDKTVVDIDRDFLNTNGVKQTANVTLREIKEEGVFETYRENVKVSLNKKDFTTATLEILKDKNVMLQKGLSENFDSSIGAGSVYMPFGGKLQLTPSTVMAAKLPVINGYTDTTSVCSFAFNPHITDENPFLGGLYATLASVSKLVSQGVDYKCVRLTLQEFFKRLNGDSMRFGEPFQALLGALITQLNLGTAAIGGKDSMSGSFENLDVPNTLISFAVGVEEAKNLITNVFKLGDKLYLLPLSKDKAVPDFTKVKALFETVYEQIGAGNITSATVVEAGGAVSAAIKSAVGNGLSIKFTSLTNRHFETRLGDIIVAIKDEKALDGVDYEYLGEVNNKGLFTSDNGLKLPLQSAMDSLLVQTKIYPFVKQVEGNVKNIESGNCLSYFRKTPNIANPRVLLPVFPGTNCEYDTAKRFTHEGSVCNSFIIKNSNKNDIAESAEALAKAIRASQIIAFPGGFSGGDEPDGSGKFIAATFRNPLVKDAVDDLLNNRDGIILGICNGFQALIKLGLLPLGKIEKLTSTSPTLTFNEINRHVSTISRIRIATNASPWLSSFNVGDVFAVPVSHGEGRLAANDEELRKLIANGQIATQYVDLNGNATMQSPFNPNGSIYAIEGLISIDGRIFGKMGHTERYQDNLYLNIEENFDMNIFRNGIRYFR